MRAPQLPARKICSTDQSASAVFGALTRSTVRASGGCRGSTFIAWMICSRLSVDRSGHASRTKYWRIGVLRNSCSRTASLSTLLSYRNLRERDCRHAGACRGNSTRFSWLGRELHRDRRDAAALWRSTIKVADFTQELGRAVNETGLAGQAHVTPADLRRRQHPVDDQVRQTCRSHCFVKTS